MEKMQSYRSLCEYIEAAYDEYNGTYSQDVMKYSHQDIDDAFDGTPDVY